MDIRELDYRLGCTFTTSFICTARELYRVTFKNDKVLETIENLKQLNNNVTNNVTTGVHVGLNFTIEDVRDVQQTIDEIVSLYQQKHSATHIPSNLKLRDMRKDLLPLQQTSTTEKQIGELHERFIGNNEKPLSIKESIQQQVNVDMAKNLAKTKKK